MRRNRSILPRPPLAVALLALLSAAAPGCRPETPAGAPATAAPTVEFRLPSLDGPVVESSDFSGRLLLVEFWATWCAPCRAQAGILAELHSELAGGDVDFVAVSVGEDPEVVRDFAREHPFPYPVLLDSRDELTARLGIFVLPTVMILDRSGRIAYFEGGISPASKLRRALREARG